jgi:hypothetical protein
MSQAERLLLAQLKAGRTWTGDLKVSFYQPLGISAVHLDMAYRQLMAKLASVSELTVRTLERRYRGVAASTELSAHQLNPWVYPSAGRGPAAEQRGS